MPNHSPESNNQATAQPESDATFNPCVLIPVYNHHQYINNTINLLREKNIACILVDDGSCNECREVLEKIARSESWVHLFRLDENQGKGAAVCFGLTKANDLAFTHALQIDSDGQHSLDCLEDFIGTAKRFQNAVVTGMRPYSEMPSKRRYGRIITDIWVWINTLSFHLKDSMCGYRLYPLKETLALLNTTHIAKRMDFDTDILVRLYWNHVPVKQLETPVIYDDDIVSHFDLLNDNIRITRMHTKLFFGMLYRLPQLLFRTN